MPLQQENDHRSIIIQLLDQARVPLDRQSITYRIDALRQRGLWTLDTAATDLLLNEMLLTLRHPNYIEGFTMIGVRKVTRERLRRLGGKGQTYDAVVTELLKLRANTVKPT